MLYILQGEDFPTAKSLNIFSGFSQEMLSKFLDSRPVLVVNTPEDLGSLLSPSLSCLTYKMRAWTLQPLRSFLLSTTAQGSLSLSCAWIFSPERQKEFFPLVYFFPGEMAPLIGSCFSPKWKKYSNILFANLRELKSHKQSHPGMPFRRDDGRSAWKTSPGSLGTLISTPRSCHPGRCSAWTPPACCAPCSFRDTTEPTWVSSS